MRAPAHNQLEREAGDASELSEVEVDLIFHALSDGTRRDIVRRCLADE